MKYLAKLVIDGPSSQETKMPWRKDLPPSMYATRVQVQSNGLENPQKGVVRTVC